MKKLFVLFFALFSASYAFSAPLPSFPTIIFPWLSENWFTRYGNETEFRGDELITRGEATRFISTYAQLVWLSKTNNPCGFSDLTTYDTTLLPFITETCSYGLMKGDQGAFLPEQNITEAQALAVIVRAISGIQDETRPVRFEPYITYGQQRWLLTNETADTLGSTPITREKLWSRLYVAVMHYNTSLSTLASCLTDTWLVMYGTERCPHCQRQKALFGEAFSKITYVDCDQHKQQCIDAWVAGFPTWISTTKESYIGTQQPITLGKKLGCRAGN